MAGFFFASPELRLVVAVSPKCGSQSIEQWLVAAVATVTGNQDPNLESLRVTPEEASRLSEHRRVFFVRDPLRRLASFYGSMVVSDDPKWCFADEARRFPLGGKTFRQLALVLRHLHAHGLPPQHHLVPQLARTEGVEFDTVVAVEQLDAGLRALSRDLGIDVPIPAENRLAYTTTMRQPATDRSPAELRASGVPSAELFYDAETEAIALDAYADDVAYYRATTRLPVLTIAQGTTA